MEQASLHESPLATEGDGEKPPSLFMARAELAIACILTATGAALTIFMSSLIGGGGIETAEDYLHLTPDFFPRLTMGILTLVGGWYAYGAYRTLATTGEGGAAEDATKLKRAGFMVVVAICYAATVSWLGFILSTMIVASVVSYFLGLRKPWTFVPATLVVPIAIRFVFERVLYIALPRSEIEFVAAIEDSVIGALVKLLL